MIKCAWCCVLGAGFGTGSGVRRFGAVLGGGFGLFKYQLSESQYPGKRVVYLVRQSAGQLAETQPEHLSLSGQGVRDVTRIAGSDPLLWAQILSANAGPVSAVLRGKNAVEAEEKLHDFERLAARALEEHGDREPAQVLDAEQRVGAVAGLDLLAGGGLGDDKKERTLNELLEAIAGQTGLKFMKVGNLIGIQKAAASFTVERIVDGNILKY